jgi:hypothetical protein
MASTKGSSKVAPDAGQNQEQARGAVKKAHSKPNSAADLVPSGQKSFQPTRQPDYRKKATMFISRDFRSPTGISPS